MVCTLYEQAKSYTAPFRPDSTQGRGVRGARAGGEVDSTNLAASQCVGEVELGQGDFREGQKGARHDGKILGPCHQVRLRVPGSK